MEGVLVTTFTNVRSEKNHLTILTRNDNLNICFQMKRINDFLTMFLSVAIVMIITCKTKIWGMKIKTREERNLVELNSLTTTTTLTTATSVNATNYR